MGIKKDQSHEGLTKNGPGRLSIDYPHKFMQIYFERELEWGKIQNLPLVTHQEIT